MSRSTSPSPHFTRREALVAGAAGALALACDIKHSIGAEPKASDAADKPAGKFIDSHVHVWTPDTKKYPLAAGYKVADMQPPSFTPEQLLEHANPNGVGRIALVQMSFYGFDNSYMLDTMKRFPGVFSGIAVIDENDRPRETMRMLAASGVRGFRIHPASRDPAEWIATDGMAAMWKCGADEGLAMCALINPNALTHIDEMCKKHPDTPVVIDHFARIGVDGKIRPADLQNLCGLARHKNVKVKVSAFYALGEKKPPYLHLAPMIRRVLDTYGPERLMWGSDCPYQVDPGHNYRDSVALIRERLDFLSDSDREWLLTKTAEQTFFAS